MSDPSERDWSLMVFAQETAEAVRKSDNLRLPQDPEWALRSMTDIIKQQSKQKDGVA